MQRQTAATAKEGFEKFKRIKKAKNLSPETLTHYESQFKYFGEFFDVNRLCSEITEDVYYSYVEYLQKRETGLERQ